jgi:hypothetical protein
MFGCSQKVGLSSTQLPEEIIETISTEEDLLETLRNSNVIEYAKALVVIKKNYVDSQPQHEV